MGENRWCRSVSTDHTGACGVCGYRGPLSKGGQLRPHKTYGAVSTDDAPTPTVPTTLVNKPIGDTR